MKEQIEQVIKNLVMEYHAIHYDTHIRPMRYVYGENDAQAVLVWLNDWHGYPLSTLDLISLDAHGNPYVSELISVHRENEHRMLQWFRNEISDDDMREWAYEFF